MRFVDDRIIVDYRVRANASRRRDGAHLLGSPIDVTAIRRLTGCVEASDGGLRGWAWHPGDPDTAPVLTLTYADGSQQTLVARDESVTVQHAGPLARPRSFRLSAGDLSNRPGLIHVRGLDGKDMPGSPLNPFADAASHVAAASCIGLAYPADTVRRPIDPVVPAPALRADAPVPTHPEGADRKRRAPTVVIPVHNGGPVALACLASVLAARPDDARILVIDDGSSDPVLIAALDDLARRRKISLQRHQTPLGFPASANAGIRAAKGRDVVLLNSDTLVPPDWKFRVDRAGNLLLTV